MIVMATTDTPSPLKAAAVCPFTISAGITTPDRTAMIFRPTPIRSTT